VQPIITLVSALIRDSGGDREKARRQRGTVPLSAVTAISVDAAPAFDGG